MNENISKGTWKMLKGKLQEQWGDLTDDELEKSEGNIEQITGSIQKRYGIEQDKVQDKINTILEDINNKLS